MFLNVLEPGVATLGLNLFLQILAVCFIGKLGISILKHFDYQKLLGRNIQLLKILNGDWQESSQYIFFGQKEVQLLGISQVCVPQALRIPSYRKAL